MDRYSRTLPAMHRDDAVANGSDPQEPIAD